LGLAEQILPLQLQLIQPFDQLILGKRQRRKFRSIMSRQDITLLAKTCPKIMDLRAHLRQECP
jgi:hypothetical protein